MSKESELFEKIEKLNSKKLFKETSEYNINVKTGKNGIFAWKINELSSKKYESSLFQGQGYDDLMTALKKKNFSAKKDCKYIRVLCRKEGNNFFEIYPGSPYDISENGIKMLEMEIPEDDMSDIGFIYGDEIFKMTDETRLSAFNLTEKVEDTLIFALMLSESLLYTDKVVFTYVDVSERIKPLLDVSKRTFKKDEAIIYYENVFAKMREFGIFDVKKFHIKENYVSVEVLFPEKIDDFEIGADIIFSVRPYIESFISYKGFKVYLANVDNLLKIADIYNSFKDFENNMNNVYTIDSSMYKEIVTILGKKKVTDYFMTSHTKTLYNLIIDMNNSLDGISLQAYQKDLIKAAESKVIRKLLKEENAYGNMAKCS